MVSTGGCLTECGNTGKSSDGTAPSSFLRGFEDVCINFRRGVLFAHFSKSFTPYIDFVRIDKIENIDQLFVTPMSGRVLRCVELQCEQMVQGRHAKIHS